MKEKCERKFKAITEAYDTLRDGTKRARYDRFGADGGGHDSGGHEFSFAQADALFRDFFGRAGPRSSPIDPFPPGFGADPFGGGFMGGAATGIPRGHGHHSGDPFADMFRAMDSVMAHMDGGVAPGGAFSSSSSSSMSFGGLGGGDGVVGRSTRSETVIRDGRRVTRTVQTVRYADGREETTTDESTGSAPSDGRMLGGGFGGPASDPNARLTR